MAESSGDSNPRRVLRVGRKVGRTVYVRTGGPEDGDDLVGLMDTPELAAAVVAAVNAVETIGELLGDPRLDGDETIATLRALLEPAWEALGTALYPPDDEDDE